MATVVGQPDPVDRPEPRRSVSFTKKTGATPSTRRDRRQRRGDAPISIPSPRSSSRSGRARQDRARRPSPTASIRSPSSGTRRPPTSRPAIKPSRSPRPTASGRSPSSPRLVPLNKPSVSVHRPGRRHRLRRRALHRDGHQQHAGRRAERSRCSATAPPSVTDADPDVVNLASGQTAPFDVVVNMDVQTQGSGTFTVVVTDQTNRTTTPTGRTLTVILKNPSLDVHRPGHQRARPRHGALHRNGDEQQRDRRVEHHRQAGVDRDRAGDDRSGHRRRRRLGSFDVSGNVSGISTDGPASFTVTVTDKKATPQRRHRRRTRW